MFRFNIGDVLVHKASEHDPNAQRFIVVALLTEQCMGGVQEMYTTRGVNVQGYTTSGAVTAADIRFFEFELALPAERPLRRAL